jgi:Plasmid pRiA4b ORF-3-like protein
LEQKGMTSHTITLRVSLEPKIFRDIEISGEASLYKLAQVITKVFGFGFDHMFGFYDNLKNPYKSKTVFELFADMGEPSVEGARGVKKSKVADAFDKDGAALAFLFDYGDEWIFKVKRTGAAESAAAKTYWKLIKSEGEAPEQYPEYEEEEEETSGGFGDNYETTKVVGLTVVTRKEKK